MMDNVRVNKDKLLGTLKENRQKHAADYETAVTAYRTVAEKTLRKQALLVRDGETLSTRIDLPEPKSFVDEYDRAIAMVDWSAEDELVLDEADFRAFVLDDWHWSRAFAGSTQHYNSLR